jgi:hypothetical protein
LDIVIAEVGRLKDFGSKAKRKVDNKHCFKAPRHTDWVKETTQSTMLSEPRAIVMKMVTDRKIKSEVYFY